MVDSPDRYDGLPSGPSLILVSVGRIEIDELSCTENRLIRLSRGQPR